MEWRASMVAGIHRVDLTPLFFFGSLAVEMTAKQNFLHCRLDDNKNVNRRSMRYWVVLASAVLCVICTKTQNLYIQHVISDSTGRRRVRGRMRDAGLSCLN